MHLGFHIYDVGFQSPNVEAARPLVYATAFLLVMIIVMLNISAIAIRNRLREKYKASEG
jgi:phosphate transport system permease protein